MNVASTHFVHANLKAICKKKASLLKTMVYKTKSIVLLIISISSESVCVHHKFDNFRTS